MMHITALMNIKALPSETNQNKLGQLARLMKKIFPVEWLLLEQRTVRPGSWIAYLIALAIVALATVIRVWLSPWLISDQFITFFPAVIVTCLICGPAAGLLALALSAVSVIVFILPSGFSLPHASGLLLFVVLGFLGVAIVAALRAAVAQLGQLNDRLKTQREKTLGLLEAAPDAMVGTSTDRTIIFVNPQTERLFGYSREEMLGQSINLLIPDRYVALYSIAQLDVAKRPTGSMLLEREFRGQRKDGAEIPLEVSVSVIHTEEGEFFSVALRDITDRKAAQAALVAEKRKAEKASAAKSRFLAAASHDLRQPLQSIALLSGILEKTASDPLSRSAIQSLDTSVSVMSEMLDTLLEVNQLEAGAVNPAIRDFAIADVLERLRAELTLHAKAKGLELRIVPCSAIVQSDPRLLEQIIRNLLSNAIKYTHEGKVLLGCRRRGGVLRIEVLDTGIGIAHDQIEAIFEEFHQIDNPVRDRRQGLGLGLSIVQRLADLLHHPIDVRSAPQKGSAFSVEVPRGRTAPSAAPALSTPSKDTEVMNVLLVEDDASVREPLKALLEVLGHRVVAVEDAVAALARIRNTEWRPEVIVSDYNLPGGVNGIETVRRVRAAVQFVVPAILLTGDGSLAAETVRAIPDCMLLRKPADAEAIVAATKRCRAGGADPRRIPVNV